MEINNLIIFINRSACVEFLNKESAELALSVNGTSFMSRIVKVTKVSYKTDIYSNLKRLVPIFGFGCCVGG